MKKQHHEDCFRGLDLLGINPDSLAWAVRWLARRGVMMNPRMVERAYYTRLRVQEKEAERLRRHAGQDVLQDALRVLQVLRRDLAAHQHMSSGRLLREVNELTAKTITPPDMVNLLCRMNQAGWITLDVNETRTLVQLTDAGRFLFIAGNDEEDCVEDDVAGVLPHGMELLARSQHMDRETQYRLMESLGLLPWVKARDGMRLDPCHIRTTLLRSGTRSVQVRIDFHLADESPDTPF